MMTIIYAVLVLGVMGLLFGLILAFASKVFAVEVDERIPAVQECLPGANCGACGFAGCSDYAKAVVEGRAPTNLCVPGGAGAAEAVSKVMGVRASATEAKKAVVRCQGFEFNTTKKMFISLSHINAYSYSCVIIQDILYHLPANNQAL